MNEQTVGEDDREWLIEQLRQWPKRVHPERTTNIEYLMKRAADALSASQAHVPAGYRLVPVEPTEAMLDALAGGYEQGQREERWEPANGVDPATVAYKSMLSASPAPLGCEIEELRAILCQVDEPAPKSLPEQDTRVGEAMAARQDDENRRAWRERIEAAQREMASFVRKLLSSYGEGEE